MRHECRRIRAGDNKAVIAKLIKNGKLYGINPHFWLSATLTSLGKGHPANSVGELAWTQPPFAAILFPSNANPYQLLYLLKDSVDHNMLLL